MVPRSRQTVELFRVTIVAPKWDPNLGTTNILILNFQPEKLTKVPSFT